MKRIRDLKINAKQALRGNYGVLILASLAAAGLRFAGSMLTGVFFPGYGVTDVILSQIFLIILSLVFSIVTAGFSYMALRVARGQECAIGDLLYFFRNHPDRVIIATLVLAVIDMLATIPVTYYNFTAELGTTMEAQMDWLVNYGLLLMISTVVSTLLCIPFAMIYFLLSDDSEMSGMEAVKASARMMKGKIGRYLLLQISFVPLLILSVFTLYIALLWIVPYMETASAMFYRDAMGEFNAPSIEEASAYDLDGPTIRGIEEEDNSEA